MTVFTFEPSGKIALPSDEELLRLDKENAIIAYTSGVTQEGKSYYAFVAVRPSAYKKFRRLTLAKQPIILSEYGDVLASGYTARPEPEVVEMMQQKYGCDLDYETSLVNEALKQQGVFAKKHEEKRIDDIVSMLKKRAQPQ
jgi:hypothetical protein